MRRAWKAKDVEDRDTPGIAWRLLGTVLVVRGPEGGLSRWRITETEAYDGPEDRASHAWRGLTPRNAVMFGPAGRWYVYLCYGVHEMLNLVTGPRGYPAAVLIRGVEGIDGPGRLTRSLGIDRRFNGRAMGRASGLWIESAKADADLPAVEAGDISVGPRVGIDYAGPEWAARPWRFRWRPGVPRRAR